MGEINSEIIAYAELTRQHHLVFLSKGALRYPSLLGFKSVVFTTTTIANMGWSHRKDHLEQDIETGKICTCSRREDAEKHTICSKLRTTIHIHRKLARRDPQLILLALFLFAVLLGAGVAIATVFVNAHRSEMKSDAIALAEETGNFFKSRLDNAILPLFSLTQFVTEIDSFRTLVQRIGLPGEEGSLPFLPPDDGNTRTHRNVTGVCDDPFLVKKFERIAGSIKRDSKMQRILVNLQLVPNGVVCLVHPINNTEDFPPGIFMDNTGALGHDLLTDPARKVIVAKALPRENVSIVGPVTLRQCDNCDPTVEKAFIARLPILSDTNVISINGVNHMRWGFAAALINWNELVQNSSIYHDFESKGMEFQLTRTDKTPGVKDESTINKNVSVFFVVILMQR